MSEDGAEPQGQLLQYMNLRVSLLSNLNLLRSETMYITTMPNNRLKRFNLEKWAGTVSDRKEALLAIGRESLSSSDYAVFKDLVNTTIAVEIRGHDPKKLFKRFSKRY